MGTSAYPELHVQARRVEEDLMALARMTDPQLPYTRQAFTPYDREARQWLLAKMEQVGLEVRIDAAANIIGRRKGRRSGGPVIMLGSHIDTVRAGGRYDGMVGVIGALEVIRCLNEAGWTSQHSLEMVSFTCEEPTAFGLSPMGSRAMAGTLAAEQVLAARGPEGNNLAESLAYVGGDAHGLGQTRRRPGEIAGFLELHIEQGPVLEREGLPIGVVTAIAAPCRGRATLVGEANHSGATMMHERHDALCGAAEVVLAVERACSAPGVTDTVGTVGYLNVSPNMVNVIPGKVGMQVEVRSTRQDFLDMVRAQVEQSLYAVAERRGLEASLEWLACEQPVPIPEHMQGLIQQACDELGIRWMPLPSRASHDAARIASITPIGMVFVPSRAGKSHTPEEWTDFDHIARGVAVLGRALMKLDARFG
ncbi:MAG: Zn-dependent hydrolase [Chloroflexi bacterium]|nr:Zn-dependent hydrolase [Chloroflexota bacterium]